MDTASGAAEGDHSTERSPHMFLSCRCQAGTGYAVVGNLVRRRRRSATPRSARVQHYHTHLSPTHLGGPLVLWASHDLPTGCQWRCLGRLAPKLVAITSGERRYLQSPTRCGKSRDGVAASRLMLHPSFKRGRLPIEPAPQWLNQTLLAGQTSGKSLNPLILPSARASSAPWRTKGCISFGRGVRC